MRRLAISANKLALAPVAFGGNLPSEGGPAAGAAAGVGALAGAAAGAAAGAGGRAADGGAGAPPPVAALMNLSISPALNPSDCILLRTAPSGSFISNIFLYLRNSSEMLSAAGAGAGAGAGTDGLAAGGGGTLDTEVAAGGAVDAAVGVKALLFGREVVAGAAPGVLSPNAKD